MDIKINSEVTKGNFELEKVLRAMAAQMGFGMVGNVYLVMTAATEPNYNVWVKQNKKYDDGSEMIQASVELANAATLTNRNDVIFLSANGTSNKVAAMLTVANNRVHFVGLDPNGRKRGARCLVSNTGAGAATDYAMVKVTGTGCSFHNISFKNNWTVAQNVSSVWDKGSNTFFENCDIESLGSAHLTNAAASSLKLEAVESEYKNCTIGQSTLLATVASGQQMLISGDSQISARCIFESCLFQAWTSQITHVFIRAAAASINSSQHTFNDCIFSNRSTAGGGGVELTAAVATSATLGGRLNFGFPRIFGAADLATSAGGATGVFVVSPVLAAAASDCIGVQAS
jgi:hypothetical protein